MMHRSIEMRRKYDRWITVPVSTAAVFSAFVSFAAHGWTGAAIISGSATTTRVIDNIYLYAGIMAMVASWTVLLIVSRRGGKR